MFTNCKQFVILSRAIASKWSLTTSRKQQVRFSRLFCWPHPYPSPCMGRESKGGVLFALIFLLNEARIACFSSRVRTKFGWFTLKFPGLALPKFDAIALSFYPVYKGRFNLPTFVRDSSLHGDIPIFSNWGPASNKVLECIFGKEWCIIQKVK